MDLSTARHILGLPPTYSWREARLAWRRAASRHHPDKEGGSAEAFGRARTAWELIDALASGASPASASTPAPAAGNVHVGLGTSFEVRELRCDGRPLKVRARAVLFRTENPDGSAEVLLHVDLFGPCASVGSWFEATLVVQNYVASVRGPVVGRSNARPVRGVTRVEAFVVRPSFGAR